MRRPPRRSTTSFSRSVIAVCDNAQADVDPRRDLAARREYGSGPTSFPALAGLQVDAIL